MQTIRRVIVGVKHNGDSTVTTEETLSLPEPGVGRLSIWAADSPPLVPNAGDLPVFMGPMLPKTGGLHILHLSLPPGFRRTPDAMHSTPTVDCMVQVSGESVFVLPNEEVRLRAGNWLICNGAVHDWRNDGKEPSVILGIIYGAPLE